MATRSPRTRREEVGEISALSFCSALVFVLALLPSCRAEAPPRGPEAICAKACAARAVHCTSVECARGCNLVLDRLVEHEGGHVLACIAGARVCDDRAWAGCAALVGPHADGGPPAPPSGGALEVEDGD